MGSGKTHLHTSAAPALWRRRTQEIPRGARKARGRCLDGGDRRTKRQGWMPRGEMPHCAVNSVGRRRTSPQRGSRELKSRHRCAHWATTTIHMRTQRPRIARELEHHRAELVGRPKARPTAAASSAASQPGEGWARRQTGEFALRNSGRSKAKCGRVRAELGRVGAGVGGFRAKVGRIRTKFV